MTKRDNDKLNNLYMEAVQPPQSQSSVVYAIIYEVDYEGQRLLGIYSTSEAAQQALAKFGDDDDYSIKELALNQPASWGYSE
jgi:hypothetical protein